MNDFIRGTRDALLIFCYVTCFIFFCSCGKQKLDLDIDYDFDDECATTVEPQNHINIEPGTGNVLLAER